jgi:bile acid:Na+ symporter, BASS family
MVIFPSSIGRPLAFIGRHGNIAFAISIFLGLALPQLAEAARPFLTLTVFIFTMLSYARVDMESLKETLARPVRLTGLLIWSTIAPALVLAGLILLLGKDAVSDEMLLGLVLYAASPALNGSPAFAMLLGYRNGLILTILFIQLIVTPFVSPFLAALLIGHELPISATALGLRLALVVFGATLGAVVIRRWIGVKRLGDARHELNGFNVVLYFLFAIAAMDGVIDATIADPGRTVMFLIVTFAFSALCLALALVTGRGLGNNDNFTLAIGIGLRNIGLLVAAFGPTLPPETFLYFSLSQFPSYLCPILLAPIARFYRP